MNSMAIMRLMAWGGLVAGMASAVLRAQLLPYEFVDTRSTPNFQSTRGVPISRVVGTPPGSDGRVPFSNESSPVFVPPTAGQFRTLSVVGGSSGLKQSAWSTLKVTAALNAGTAPLTGDLAVLMGLPVGKDGSGIVVAFTRRMQVGAHVFVRRSTLNFGSVVPPPVSSETGVMLPETERSDYWLPEPYTVTAHEGSGYYWSPHAGRAYAIQSGPISVTWIKAQPVTLTSKPNYVNPAGPTSFLTNGANVFILYTQRYVVSGAPVKPPRNMYWTQKDFQGTGKPIVVPKGRVGGVKVVYNNSFPKTVGKEFQAIGATSPTDGSTNSSLQELRTLWYEQQLGTIYAYNQDGRVFVEMLGDPRGDGTHASLGFEIVDVVRQPYPKDVRVDLGERVVPPLGESPDDYDPEPVVQPGGVNYAYMYSTGTANRISYYATRETRNANDFLVHWMESGVAGIKWPRHYARYTFGWPTEVGRYSLYVRPEVTTDQAAQATAVLLDAQNAPNIEYQDPLDRPRAQFTSDLKFYTFLDAQQPAHRTLLRYTTGDQVGFERVFSWLVGNLRTTNFVGNAVVTNLTAWTGTTLQWPDATVAPRVVNETDEVGARIQPPAGELGSLVGQDYLAGYVNLQEGDSLSMDAYKDPFVAGFDAASSSSIIPVNDIPGRDRLEVWWFRKGNARAGLNTGNTNQGFAVTLWPSVVGRYTIQWPSDPREIVLASKLGGIDARIEEARGAIYVQNDKTRAGYNPNEEHAIMSGGIPYATRDDLNVETNVNGEYSSAPFVLVAYDAFDGRPAMATYRILREKPSVGWVFDYTIPAGQLLQRPPPRTFLQKPTTGAGDTEVSRNYEPRLAEQDLPGGWVAGDGAGSVSHYQRFTYQDRKQNMWVYRGPHAGLPVLRAGTYDPDAGAIVPLTTGTAVVGSVFRVAIHASRQDEFLSLTVPSGPSWVASNGMGFGGTLPSGSVGSYPVTYVVRDLYDGTAVTNTVTLQVVASGVASVQAPLAVTSTNRYTGSVVTFSNRAPFLARSPDGANSFTMRYYYKTEASFSRPSWRTPGFRAPTSRL